MRYGYGPGPYDYGAGHSGSDGDWRLGGASLLVSGLTLHDPCHSPSVPPAVGPLPETASGLLPLASLGRNLR